PADPSLVPEHVGTKVAAGDDQVQVAVPVQVRGQDPQYILCGGDVDLGGEPTEPVVQENDQAVLGVVVSHQFRDGDDHIQVPIPVEITGREVRGHRRRMGGGLHEAAGSVVRQDHDPRSVRQIGHGVIDETVAVDV